MLKLFSGCVAGILLTLILWFLMQDNSPATPNTPVVRKTEPVSDSLITHKKAAANQKPGKSDQKTSQTDNLTTVSEHTRTETDNSDQAFESTCGTDKSNENKLALQKAAATSLITIFEPYATLLGRSKHKINIALSDCILEVVALHRRLESESKDFNWAHMMESHYHDFLSNHPTASVFFKAESVECRATLCEIQLKYKHDYGALNVSDLQLRWLNIRRDMFQQFWWSEMDPVKNRVYSQYAYEGDNKYFTILSIDSKLKLRTKAMN